MCAKESAKAGRPSKTPSKSNARQTNRTPGRAQNRQSVASQNSQSNNSDSEDQSSSSSLDFLGRPVTPPPSDSNDTSEQGYENEDGNVEDEEEQEEEEEEDEPPPPPSPKKRPAKGESRKSTEVRRKQTRPRKYDKTTKEIIKLQRTTDLLIPKLPFQRLVREVLQSFDAEFRVQQETLQCLQEASESYITTLFEDSYLCTLHRSRVTLSEKDLRLVRILRGPVDPGRR